MNGNPRIRSAWSGLLRTLLHRLHGVAALLLPARLPGFALPIPPLSLDPADRQAVVSEQRKLLAAAASEAMPIASDTAVTEEEQEILAQIARDVASDNRNNVTRTAAYLRIFRGRPELHWAFLAHMVSRNGGWSMTDLKGDPLSGLVPDDLKLRLFLFLERCNALIFQDAAPQLLLYEESKRRGRPLFRLLPHLGVSRFMRPVWERFWDTRDPVLLTVGLIMNEQNLIERHVLAKHAAHEQVLDRFLFQAYGQLKFNHVYLPYQAPDSGGPLRLAGVCVRRFPSVGCRVATGRRLYGLLFGRSPIAMRIRAFAESRPHTGSRADYWPHLFARRINRTDRSPDSPRLDGLHLSPGSGKLLSPALEEAWPDHPFQPPEPLDWFASADVLKQWKAPAAPLFWDMTDASSLDLNALEAASWLKDNILVKR